MTDSLSGLVGFPILAGQVLDQAAVSEGDIRVRKLASIVQLANGGRREGHRHAGRGHQLVGATREIVLRYRHIREHQDLVEEIFAGPGPHDLVIWKRVHPQFVGNGFRTEFHLRHRVATHVYASPAGFPADRFAVEARVGINGSVLTVETKSEAAYDAGDPPASEAWFVDGGKRFKLGAAPAAGARVFVRMVPIFEVFEEVESARRYPLGSGNREPRDITVVEA